MTLQPSRHNAAMAARRVPWNAQQRRSFLGLQRTPTPKPHVQGLLVAQGLAVVLLVDYAVAAMQGSKTTLRSTLEFCGMWKVPPSFDTVHNQTGATGRET